MNAANASFFKDKHYAIFGCGYIGSAVAKALIHAGARVHTLTRNAEKIEQLNALGVRTALQSNLHSTHWHTDMRSALGKAKLSGVLVSVAAADRSEAGYRSSYIEGNQSVLEFLNTHIHNNDTHALKTNAGAPKHNGGNDNNAATQKNAGAPGALAAGAIPYIYTSSTGVYAQSGGATVTEAMPAEASTPTGTVLREAEALVRGYPGHVILRLAGIHGPGRNYLKRQLKGGAPTLRGSGTHYLNRIHQADATTAIMQVFAAAPSAWGGTFNVSDGAPIKKETYVAQLCAELGRGMPSFDDADMRATAAALGPGGRTIPNRKICSKKFQQTFNWVPKHAAQTHTP